MKKLIVGLILMLSATASYATTYTCIGYYEGSVVGEPVKLEASKASVAETKAKARLKKAGHKVSYVDCK